jgi:hypothetical protein
MHEGSRIVLGRRMTARSYRTYSRAFQVLLAVADGVTWLYFFGIPFLPNALPHLSDIGPVIHFFARGLQQ